MKLFLKIFIPLLLISILGIAGYEIYKFQQSTAFIKAGNQALLRGDISGAKENYDKARDAFPYRPAASQVFEGLNIINDTNEAYNTTIPNRVIPTPSVSVPLNQVTVPILMYHQIQANPLPTNPLWSSLFVSPNQLDDQLKYLISQNYHVVTLDDVQNALDGKEILPQNPIVLTFDDGYQNFYDNGYPLLRKYNARGIEFVITNVVGSGVYLNWNEIKTLYASGFVTFGAHTRHHPFLTSISSALAIDEISGSKSDLEKQLKTKIMWFAYPYGDYNPKVVSLVKSAGFRGSVTTNPGATETKDGAFTMPRIMVDGRFNITRFASVIQSTK